MLSKSNLAREKERPSSSTWLGLIEHACQISTTFSTTYLQKTAWTSDAFDVWGDTLEPACCVFWDLPSTVRVQFEVLQCFGVVERVALSCSGLTEFSGGE